VKKNQYIPSICVVAVFFVVMIITVFGTSRAEQPTQEIAQHAPPAIELFESRSLEEWQAIAKSTTTLDELTENFKSRGYGISVTLWNGQCWHTRYKFSQDFTVQAFGYSTPDGDIVGQTPQVFRHRFRFHVLKQTINVGQSSR
jgi:hypothetical protein